MKQYSQHLIVFLKKYALKSGLDLWKLKRFIDSHNRYENCSIDTSVSSMKQTGKPCADLARVNGVECERYIQLQNDILNAIYGTNNISMFAFNYHDINRNTNWGVILLFGAAISLGIQMKQTGAALWVAEKALTNLEFVFQDVTIVRWFVSVFLTGILTNLLSNAATVAVLGPIVLDMGGSAMILGIATSVASAFAYLTIVASPTCMIIHSTGLIKSSDYFKAGWKLFFISIVLYTL